MTNATHLLERLVKLLPVLTVVACAYFAALMVNDYVEAAYIGEPAPVSAAPRAPRPALPTAASKDGTRLAERNMFCSTCETTEHQPAIAVAAAGSTVPDTALPLRLVNTNLSTDAESSWATVANHQSSRRGAYWIGQNIPGGGPIQKITGRYVDFTNTTTNRLERIRLDRPVAAARTPTPRNRGSKTADAQRLEDSVRQVNDTTWEVDRSVLSFLSGNPTALRSVRVSPAVKNGKPAGFRISRLSSRSPVAKIGVKRGDIIRAANGTELTSPDVVLKLMTQVKTLNRMVITVERGGKNIELTYLLR